MQRTPSAQSNSQEVKLKPMELKKFRGHFEEWLPFWEQFRVAVHNNDSLTVAGRAAATIAGFLPTADCYAEAIKTLKDEYGNNDNIIEKYIQKLVAIKPIQSANDVKGLRFLYNEVSATMRTLTALKVPSSKYELMVKSILLKSIPSTVRINYHRSTVKNNGEIKTLLEFLKLEVEAIEKSLLSENENKTNEIKRDHKYKGTATALLTTAPSSSTFCIFCKNSNHHTRQCKSRMSLSDKRSLLRREGRCYRCTNKSHTSKFCKAQWIKCDECGGRHMTSLCERKKEEQNEEKKVEKQTSANSTTTSLNMVNNTSTTSLNVVNNT